MSKEIDNKIYKSIFEHASDGFLIADINTKKFVFANPQICKMIGYSQQELLKLDVNKIHPKKDLSYILGQFKLQAQGKIILARDLPVLRKDKKIIYCDISSRPLNLRKQKLMLRIFRDVTGRKEIEEKIKLNSQEWKNTFDSISDLIFILDRNLEFVNVNKAASDFLKKSPERLVGKKCYKLVHCRDKPWPNCPSVKAIRTGKPAVEEVIDPIVGLPLLITASPIFNSKKEVMGVVHIAKDISDIKKAEEELKESETKHRTLFETSRDAIMTLEPPSWKFTSGNPATVKMFGVKDEKEFTSKGPWEVSPKHQPDGQLSTVKAKKMISKAMKEGTNFFEWQHMTIQGEEFPATVLLTRVELGGKKFLQATVRDITGEKKTRDSLKKRADELEKFGRFAIGRELKMVELKKEVNELLDKLGEKPKYNIHRS